MLAGNSAGRLVLARSRRCLRLAAMQEQKGISLFDECKLRCRGHVVGTAEQAIHVHPVQNAALDNFLQTFTHPQAAGWAKINNFKAKVGEILLLPDSEGGLSCVLLGVGSSASDPWAYAALPGKLPPGIYTIAPDTLMDSCSATADSVLLGWVLGCYKYSRYKTGILDKKVVDWSSDSPAAVADTSAADKPLLLIPPQANQAVVYSLAEAMYWCRDLINTPAEDLSPQQLAAEAQAMASANLGATVKLTQGDDLLTANYPAVHTVGRAAARPPVLVDLAWEPPTSSSRREGSTSGSCSAATQLPLVALVGKGVCFDSGGLNIKTGQGMKLMKKDMGGAALVLALSHVIMSAGLPVRLRVLVPAVENAISGSAYRPGDVLQTRAGITVENNNTDAEGRLILCDAVFEAACGGPDVLIDAATLTGAARVALGQELPAVFTNCEDTWKRLEAAAQQESDPLWRLPLWSSYRKQLESKVADLSNVGGEAGQAGAITAALFLHEFAKAAPAWVHVDTAAWVSGGSVGPGRPEGGEALGLRALWRFLQDRFSE